jgi:hypothetical protein
MQKSTGYVVVLIIALMVTALKCPAQDVGDTGKKLLNLAKKHFEHDPTFAEKMILLAAANGTNFCFPTNSIHQHDLNNSVEADCLLWLCTDPDASKLVTFRGVQITGMEIVGPLNFKGAKLDFPLDMENCVFQQPIDLEFAHMPCLDLDGSQVKEITAKEITVDHDIDLGGHFKALGKVILQGAYIGGDLQCSSGYFESPKTNLNISALDVSKSKIEGSVLLNGDFNAQGEVNFIGANIGRDFDCSSGQFNAMGTNFVVLQAERIAIGGSVFLRDHFKASGEVDFMSSKVEKDIDCGTAQFNLAGTNSSAALKMERSTIGGNVFLWDNFCAQGQVDFTGTTIGGIFSCAAGKIILPKNENDDALNAENTKISGDVNLGYGFSNPFQAMGTVDFAGATIGGDLNCAGGKFILSREEIANDENAFNATGADISGNVYLQSDSTNFFMTTGEVNFGGATIGRDLNCTGGKFLLSDDLEDDGDDALNVENAVINGDVLLNNDSTNLFKATGEIDLGGTTIGGDLNCSAAQISVSSGEAINAVEANVKGAVFLRSYSTNPFVATGDVNLAGLTVGYDLNCKGGEFFATDEDDDALNADGTKIGDDVFLRDDSNDVFIAIGKINFDGANIEGDLDCSAAQITYSGTNGNVLEAISAKIGGNVNLCNDDTNLFIAKGEVEFLNASIGGDLNCMAARFSSSITNSEALDFERAKINGCVFLRNDATNPFVADGGVNLISASIGGDLDCSAGRFTNLIIGQYALDFARVKIGGEVFLRNSGTNLFTANGEVNLVGASVEGDLDCSAGRLTDLNAGECALNANGANIKRQVLLGTVYLPESVTNNFVSEGEISFQNAVIGETLDCSSGKFLNGTNVALNAASAQIGGNVLFNRGFTSEGEMQLIDANIGGDLDCGGGIFSEPRTNKCALIIERATIGGDVFLRYGFEGNGKVALGSVNVGNRLEIHHVASPEKMNLDLSFARVKTYEDDRSSWPRIGNLHINHFIYQDLDEDDPLNATNGRLTWLGLQDTNQFAPQPYEQLATVLRNNGFEDEATTVMIDKNLAQSHFTKTFSLSWWWYNVFGKFIRYGYRPIPALWASVGFVLIGWLIFTLGFNKKFRTIKDGCVLDMLIEFFTSGKCRCEWVKEMSIELVSGSEYSANGNLFSPTDAERAFDGGNGAFKKTYPKFNAFIFSLETFLPLVKLEMGDYWQPDANKGEPMPDSKRAILTTGALLRIYFWIHIIAGWILTTLLVGALAGLIKT